METMGLYAAAVVAANMAGVDAVTLNYLTLGYLASRVVYYTIYCILQDNRAYAPVRSLAWTVGIALTLTMYIKAGLKMS
jgi:uncharacterized MAPEG superfamily protein